VERRALLAPDQLAVVYGRTSCTHGELADRVRRLAHGLAEVGVGHGDRVVWLGASHPAFLETLFATAQLGAIFAPVNHRLDDVVIGKLVIDYSAKVAVVGPDAASISLPSSVVRRVAVGTANGADLDYDELVAHSTNGPVDRAVHFDDVCLLPHTSGTTGQPKGVMLTHANVTWNVVNVLSVVDVRSDDVTLAVAPFFRTGGTGVNVLPVLFKGGTVVIPERAEPDEILRLLEERRVTLGFGNPDLLDALIRSPRWSTAELGAIRCFITGGAPVPERLIRAYLDRGVPLFQGYGLSEAAPLVSLLDAPSSLRKVGSAGKPAMFVDMRTVRPDGTTCTTNETGELLVRGPNVMSGYWNQPAVTRATIDEHGWLHTGDAARIDDEGYAWIVDRVVDAYEVAGRSVYPGDVERALRRHPAVLDVGVVAQPGTSVAFVVVASGATVTAEELLDLAREELAEHEVPSSVVFVDTLPRNSVGKLLRQELARASTGGEGTRHFR
jgi:fatty-acyl-CoA synthase